jgi:hypothetical protein
MSKPTLQVMYTQSASLGVLTGLPNAGWAIECVKQQIPNIFNTSKDRAVHVIQPTPRTFTTKSGVVYEDIPPAWVFAGAFEGNPHKDGDSAELIVIWFGDTLAPDLDKVLPEVEANWALAKDMFF